MSDSLAIIGTALKGAGWVFLPFLLLPILTFFAKPDTALARFSAGVIRTIDSANYGLGEIAKWLLPILVLSVAFSVFALSIFGLSWTKLFESASYFHATVIMLGAGATLLAGQHVRVDIFHSRMKPETRAMVDFCGFYLFLMPVCLIILWNSQTFIGFSWQIFEGSAEADGIRGQFLLKTLVPLFCVMMLTQGAAIAMRAALCLTGRSEPERPPHTPPLFSDHEPEAGL